MQNSVLNQLSQKNNEANIRKYKDLVLSTARAGVKKFMEWLDTTDFYTAPGASKLEYHSCKPGGLLQHTLNVMELGIEKIKKFDPSEVNSMTLAAACHDLCKIDNYFSIDALGLRPDSQGRIWYQGKPYKIGEYYVENRPPFLGHGEKSVYLAVMNGLELSYGEASAIRWHMGPFDPAWKDYPCGFAFQACHKSWLARLLFTADYEAALMEK